MVWVSTAGTPGANAPIIVAKDDGSNPVQVGRVSQPVLSPDGTRLAFQVVSQRATARRVRSSESLITTGKTPRRPRARIVSGRPGECPR
jgi:hypothetical protein